MSKLTKATVALAMAFIAGGCTTTGYMADAERVAFGSFELVSNGHDVKLGHGPAKRQAAIEVRNILDQTLYSGRVGDDGQFALALPAGEYLIETIAFEHHEEMIEAPANFRFSVPAELKSVYIGSVTLEASLDSGIYGVVGTADRYTVNNECADGCGSKLKSLGLRASNSGISLMSWDYQVAANR